MGGITLTTGRGTTVARRAHSRGLRGVEPLPNSPETAMADPARPTTRGGATRFVPTGKSCASGDPWSASVRAFVRRGRRPCRSARMRDARRSWPGSEGDRLRSLSPLPEPWRSGRAWLRLPIGSVTGLITVQILGSLPMGREGPPNSLPPPMALAVTVITGVGGGRIRGHGDAIRESSVVTPERRSRAVGGGSRGWSTPGGRGGDRRAQGDGP